MNIMSQGRGELFTDPDPDHAREIFHQKSRKIVNKAMPLAKAVVTFVYDGDYLAMGGLGGNRAPIEASYDLDSRHLITMKEERYRELRRVPVVSW